MQAVANQIIIDRDIPGCILDVIEGADKYLVLVSPYVNRIDRLEQALLRVRDRHVSITIVVRQDDDTLGGDSAGEAIGWFEQNSIKVKGVPNLHAKFYLNETEGVLTSMNLLRYSWTRSRECGVLVTGAERNALARYYSELNRMAGTAQPKAPFRPKPVFINVATGSAESNDNHVNPSRSSRNRYVSSNRGERVALSPPSTTRAGSGRGLREFPRRS
jgi:phosphatidylserine/phosphatidylglycerophosphate/cardiolipin synthase-like enzyme